MSARQAVLAALVLLSLAGCGGESNESTANPPLDPAARYEQEFREAVRATQAAADRIESDDSVETPAEQFHLMSDLMGDLADDLRAIEAPPDIRMEHRGFATAIRESARGIEKVAVWLDQGKRRLVRLMTENPILMTAVLGGRSMLRKARRFRFTAIREGYDLGLGTGSEGDILGIPGQTPITP